MADRTSQSAQPAQTLVVRSMCANDLERVAAIESSSFSDPWPASAFLDLMEQPYARLRVAVDQAQVVYGYCVLLRAADEGEIANIACAPEHRRTGVAGILLDDALEAADAEGADAVYLEVRTSNNAARALYASRNFDCVGRRRSYYQLPTEDALVLRRTRSDLLDGA